MITRSFGKQIKKKIYRHGVLNSTGSHAKVRLSKMFSLQFTRHLWSRGGVLRVLFQTKGRKFPFHTQPNLSAGRQRRTEYFKIKMRRGRRGATLCVYRRYCEMGKRGERKRKGGEGSDGSSLAAPQRAAVSKDGRCTT